MGIYLSSPRKEKSSEDGENAMVRYGLSSMQGWRTTMEDAHAAYPDLDSSTSFFAVYDGHGGAGVARFCAKYLHEQVLKNEACSAGDLGGSVRKAFLRMDEMMRGERGWRELAKFEDRVDRFSRINYDSMCSPMSDEFNDQNDDWTEEGPNYDFRGPNSGSTACVAIIRGDQLLVANAGDSRCVLSRAGEAYDLSTDHKPELQEEKERILKAGGCIQHGRVNGVLNLARAIGDSEFKMNKSLPAEKQMVTANPEINTASLCNDDDFMVLACDGIWDCMTSQELVEFVHEQLNSGCKLSAVCEKVLDKCLAPSSGGEGCDNMTMILVQFKKPIHSSASAGKQEPLPSDIPSGSNQTPTGTNS